MRIGIINVGASAFRMYVGEYTGNKEKKLDFLIKPLRIGADTFTQGYITLENVKKATEILKLFRLKLDEYKVDTYRAVCTSGVREALNKDFFLDYTLLHSDIKLEVLDSAEEIYIKYVGAKNSVKNFSTLEAGGLVFANVASGNVTLNITHKNTLVYAGTLPYGSLRMRQMFLDMPQLRRNKAIEEYVSTMLSRVASTIDPGLKLSHLLGSGSSINLILRLFGTEEQISHEQLTSIYEEVRALSPEEISKKLSLREDEADVLVPMLITYIELLNFVKAHSFSFSIHNFPQTLARYHTGIIKDSHKNARLRSTLVSVAKKYRSDTRHAKWVSFFARKLFLALEELHSLSKGDLFVLESAAILSDVGYFISSDASAENAYHIVKALRLPGLETHRSTLAANIVFEAMRTARQAQTFRDNLTAVEQLTVIKLSAILRLAKALDASRARNITDIEVSVGDVILVSAYTELEPYLEIYSFEKQKQYFLEIFGVALELKVRINYE